MMLRSASSAVPLASIPIRFPVKTQLRLIPDWPLGSAADHAVVGTDGAHSEKLNERRFKGLVMVMLGRVINASCSNCINCTITSDTIT